MSQDLDPPPTWRERVRRIGKPAFIREEMERLGFWTPADVRSEQAAAALAELSATTEELQLLRTALARLDAEIGEVEDLPKLLAEGAAEADRARPRGAGDAPARARAPK